MPQKCYNILMENPNENISESRRIAQKYEKNLRSYVEKLKAAGITKDEAQQIYKVALEKLMKLEEQGGSVNDKAAAIELSAREVLGRTRYEVVKTQARMKKEVKFRIKEVLDQPNE